MKNSICQLTFYVPHTHLEQVKSALFQVGAGRIGNYDSCSWQTAGLGQFRPLDGSSPSIGRLGNIEKVVEYKVEMVLDKSILNDVVQQLRRSHPYEEPAYFITDSLSLYS